MENISREMERTSLEINDDKFAGEHKIQEVIDYLLEVQNKYTGKDLYLSICSSGYDYVCVELEECREETDEEYENRLSAIQRQYEREKLEEKKKENYEKELAKLNKKYNRK